MTVDTAGVDTMAGVAATSQEQALERRLVRRARAGDRQALRELIDLHKDRLFAFVRRMIRNHHDAEEVCQDTFLKAFAALDTYSTQYRFSTWLFTIGYRVCLNSMRRKRALTGEVDFAALPLHSEETPEKVAESEDASRMRQAVWEAVQRLTPPQRAAVVLYYRHEHSCLDIARVLQLPEATVKSHLHRARARLRDLLAPISETDLNVFRNRAGLAG